MSDTNKDGVTDLSEAVAGGEAHMAAQKAHVDEVAAKEAARRAEAEATATYPREFNAHTPWVDPANGHEFVGTQYGYDTEAEALDRIGATRAANKYVSCMDTTTGAFVVEETPGDFRITIED